MATGAANIISISRFRAENKIIKPAPPISARRNELISARRNELPMVPKKKPKPNLITISTSDGKWHGKWNCDYIFTLQELHLHDLSDHTHTADTDTLVAINLCVHKHAGLGMSVEGKIITSFTRRCCNCCSPYLREINTTFKVWILPSTRPVKDSSKQLPDIGGDDPSVIYVKPGHEVDLDSLIQDTIRLATSVNETCSESCEKSEPKLHHFGKRNVASVEKRWSKLLELKRKTRPHIDQVKDFMNLQPRMQNLVLRTRMLFKNSWISCDVRVFIRVYMLLLCCECAEQHIFYHQTYIHTS